MGNIKLLLLKERTYDISDIVESVTWSGRKGAAPRNISVSLIDDDSKKQGRAVVDCEEGQKCIFYWKGKELFRGIIMSHKQSESKKMTFKAYDNLIYIANNKDSFSYEKKTASYIFQDGMNRLGLPYSEIADSGHVISELVKPKTTYWDCFQEAMSQTFKATRNRFYIISEKGIISFKRRTEFNTQWVVETGVNLMSYSYSKSIEDTKTRFKLYSKEGTILMETANTELEQKIGTFQDVDKPSKDDLNDAELKELIDSMMEEEGSVKKELSINALGTVDAISGRCVFVIIKHLGIKRTFYIDEDTHTFTGNYHKMQLKLNFASKIDEAG